MLRHYINQNLYSQNKRTTSHALTVIHTHSQITQSGFFGLLNDFIQNAPIESIAMLVYSALTSQCVYPIFCNKQKVDIRKFRRTFYTYLRPNIRTSLKPRNSRANSVSVELMLTQLPNNGREHLIVVLSESMKSNCLWHISLFPRSSLPPTRISKLCAK